MLSKFEWSYNRLIRSLWLRASLVGVLGGVVALVAIPVQSLIEEPLPFNVGSEAVGEILSILATSMLTVTIFSLSVMVSAYSAASSGVTPRATKLIKQDPTTQNTLATFLGSFLFSLVGIIALSTDLYTEVGRFILFVATLVVIFSIVVTLLRWIEHLSGLGRVGRTTGQVEDKVRAALVDRIRCPALGGRPMASPQFLPVDANVVCTQESGYVQHVDTSALSECGAAADREIGVLAIPGTLVHPSRPLAWYQGPEDEQLNSRIRDAFSIDVERSFDQDPRFGFSVLAEIASRALSPGVNDAGTAIDVINRMMRLLLVCSATGPETCEEAPVHTNLQVATVALADFFDDAFLPIARDGAGLVEVQVRLQKALLALAENDPQRFRVQARRCSAQALQYAEAALQLESDKARLRQLAQRLQTS
ncbi:MAG: DUF2254 domain-containing protein [Gammaproteobacteria bacterium]|nr:DUF2254 domain-containing protein [Gammaproteobacteria bacterium]